MIRSMRKYQDSRLPQPPNSTLRFEEPGKEIDTYPTFLFTLPRIHPASKLYVDLETSLATLGGFTQWDARGAWENGKITWENVRVYLVSTDNETRLREIFKTALEELGESEGYFVHVGEHTIL